MNSIHKFDLIDGNVYLDGTPINGIKALKLSVDSRENDGLAELTLKMEVQLFGEDPHKTTATSTNHTA